MGIKPMTGSVVAAAGQNCGISALFAVTPAAANPAYLIVTGLDRDEYTAGYNLSNMGALSGNGAEQGFSNAGGDAYSVGIVYSYQAASGQYYNASYGYLNQLTFTASTNTNDNVCLSVYGTSNANQAAAYAASPYVLEENPKNFTYEGSVSVVTQPAAAHPGPIQATPDSICAAAQSFVGKAWNMDGCWVLTSNISAEAGASLPASSTLTGVPGVANGEWIVAYNGPVSASANWEQKLGAGEMVGFVTTAGGGHITTVVAGSGSTALLVDNITYENGNGSIENAAKDGSANDVLIAAPHAAAQEFNGVNPADVVVYELDTPKVSALVTGLAMTERASTPLAPLFSASNPLASQAITEWQVYNSNSGDSITLGGAAQSGDHSAASCAIVASLSSVGLLAGATVCSDSVDVRAFNGAYWGDWQSLAVSVATPAAPQLSSQTANQTWLQGRRISLALPAGVFTDPQSQPLTYAASQSNGQALPAWLSFNAATRTFAGTVPAGMQSLGVEVTATDTSGLSASESFAVTVPAAAPALTSQTPNQSWLQGKAISLALAAKTFTDPQGETLNYSATLSSGSALPSWLSFNATTRTFSGTVPAGAEHLALKVSATDSSGLSGSEVFNVTVPAAVAAKSAVGVAADVIAISKAATMLFSSVNSDVMQFISASVGQGAQVPAGTSGAFAGLPMNMVKPIVVTGSLANGVAPACGVMRWFDLPDTHGSSLLSFTGAAGSSHISLVN